MNMHCYWTRIFPSLSFSWNRTLLEDLVSMTDNQFLTHSACSSGRPSLYQALLSELRIPHRCSLPSWRLHSSGLLACPLLQPSLSQRATGPAHNLPSCAVERGPRYMATHIQTSGWPRHAYPIFSRVLVEVNFNKSVV